MEPTLTLYDLEGVEYFKGPSAVLRAKFEMFNGFAPEPDIDGNETMTTPFVNIQFLNMLKLACGQIKTLPLLNLEQVFAYLYYTSYLGVVSEQFKTQLLGKLRFTTEEEAIIGLTNWHLMSNFPKYKAVLEDELVLCIKEVNLNLPFYEEHLTKLTLNNNLGVLRPKFGMDVYNCEVGTLTKYDFAEMKDVFVYNSNVRKQYLNFYDKIHRKQDKVSDILTFVDKHLVGFEKFHIGQHPPVSIEVFNVVRFNSHLLENTPSAGVYQGADRKYVPIYIVRPSLRIRRHLLNITEI
jgi:hypothetical protein